MKAPLQFTYRLAGLGWSEARIADDETTATITATHLSDALGNLLAAVDGGGAWRRWGRVGRAGASGDGGPGDREADPACLGPSAPHDHGMGARGGAAGTGIVPSMDPDEAARRIRLEMLEAFLAAIDRRDEVTDIVSSSEHPDQAAERVRQLLGVSPLAAADILNMQWRMFTRAERLKLQDRISELRSRA